MTFRHLSQGLLFAWIAVLPQAHGMSLFDPVAEHVAIASVSNDDKLAWQLNEVLKPLADGSGSVIMPEVKNGKVALKGSSPSRDALRRMMEVAANVPGVLEVRSEVRIKPG